MGIMASDVVQMQQEVTFGNLPGHAIVDIVADESSFGHWQDGEDHYWYPWIGVAQRGASDHSG